MPDYKLSRTRNLHRVGRRATNDHAAFVASSIDTAAVTAASTAVAEAAAN